MILTNIKTSRIPNRVNLIFSNGSYLPLFIDDVVKLSLHKNEKIDEEKIDHLKSLSLSYLGREYALRQIAISPKTEKIIAQKLKIYFIKITKKFNLLSSSCDSIISQIISELNEKKLLNQPDFVNYFIQKNKLKSVTAIKFLLKQKGVDISSLKLPFLNEKESIKKILSKKRIDSEKMLDFNYKNKIYSTLYRAGFQLDDIKAAIDEYLALQ